MALTQCYCMAMEGSTSPLLQSSALVAWFFSVISEELLLFRASEAAGKHFLSLYSSAHPIDAPGDVMFFGAE